MRTIIYASREMRKEFLDHYYKFAKVKKSVLKNIYKNLTGKCSSASSEAERLVDECVADALLQLNDPAII